MKTDQEPMPRVLSLSEASERLNMKRSNTSKFLARRRVEPAFSKAQGYFWWEADIDRVKAEREADKARMASDDKRRSAALKRGQPEPPPPELARLGATQRALLSELLRHPVTAEVDAERLALRRLRDRGLVEQMSGLSSYQLSVAGRRLAAFL